MAKKATTEELEFIKFIKKFYKNNIQLNFDSYFILNYNNNKVQILFPKNKIYRMNGFINISNCPIFMEWLTKSECSVKVNNEELDLLRKAKVKDILSLTKTDNEYDIKFLINNEEHHFILKKDKVITNTTNVSFIKSLNIPKEKFDENILIIYEKEDGELTLDETTKIVFENPIKNLNIIFKKTKNQEEEPIYSILLSDNINENNIKIAAIKGENSNITMFQYFKVI